MSPPSTPPITPTHSRRVTPSEPPACEPPYAAKQPRSDHPSKHPPSEPPAKHGHRDAGAPSKAADEHVLAAPDVTVLEDGARPPTVLNGSRANGSSHRANATNDMRHGVSHHLASSLREGVRLRLLHAVNADGGSSYRYPAWAYATLLAMVGFLIWHAMLLNGELDPSLTPCHQLYWPLYSLPIPVYGGCLALLAYRRYAAHTAMVAASGACAEGELAWTRHTSLLLPPIAVLSGMLSGMLGIGGGMVLGPLFLILDVHPQVVTATTGFMLLFTGLAGTVEYTAAGALPWRFLLWFGALGVVGGQVGQRVVRSLVERTGRPSIVIFLLGGIIALAVVFMTAIGIARVASRAALHLPIGHFHLELLRCHPDA